MDARSATSEPRHFYSSSPWMTNPATSSISSSSHHGAIQHSSSTERVSDATAIPVLDRESIPYLSYLESPPTYLIPCIQYQLLQYNKLVSPARGGGLQTPPLPPVVSSPNIHTGPRSRSSSRVSLKDVPARKGATSGGNGSRSHQHPDQNNHPVVAYTESHSKSKMPGRQPSEVPRSVQPRPTVAASMSNAQSHSSSVPSTPHHHARQFSFESREPSPNAGNDHSPRSAYSETNSTLPSLRPLPPRLGGCKYETAQVNSRRRIPYSVGNDRLEKLDLRTVKNKLTEDEEKQLAFRMRECYDRLLPTREVEAKRTKLVRKLETIFNEEWPGHDICVNLFGSSGNLLCSDDSDLDICITTSWHELEGVCMIADLLARRGMEKVVCISAAKVPIVKIWDPELSLACDMNVNNTLALENTRMVRTYVEADPRVRQLAMIIKYWTRRRIVNDAAFGGTLSSYTWICLIIAFLQLRNPPVLPALHQMPFKMTKPDGTVSEFADNLRRIRGFGNKNKSSVAELLFQFFRFYAHEFDYDKYVLSIRSGQLITKQEKKWNYLVNNQLCVEEPFNTNRNLGNTADEYSFRGLHLELRRAFDHLTQGKLEEACEQYVFPKEEERVWTRPAAQSRPVLLRSSSQTHSSRGGRGHGNTGRGGRHTTNFHRGGGGSNRRASASTSAYDANMFMAAPLGLQQDISWYQSPHYQIQYTQQDLMTQMAAYQQLQLIAPTFLQHQAASQPQHASASSGPGTPQQSTTDRSRTNSFDNLPIGASMRPDLYALYGMNLGPAYFPQNSYGTYPSSPATATTPGYQEFRRPLQRSMASTDGNTSAAAGSLRSQSQPAQRSPSTEPSSANYGTGSQAVASAATEAPRNVSGIHIPSFMSDDGDFDETPKAMSGSSQPSDAKATSFFQSIGPSPHGQTQPALQRRQQQQQQHVSTGIAFGDIATAQSPSPGRRRLSIDQLPQTLLDRRMRRASRSPSPMGHTRAISVGGNVTSTAALASSADVQANKAFTRPLVVNGSGLKTSMTATRGSPGQHMEPAAQAEPSAVRSDHVPFPPVPVWPARPPPGASSQNSPPSQIPADGPPVVVNGSNAPPVVTKSRDKPVEEATASFRQRIDMMQKIYLSDQPNQQQELPSGNVWRLSPSARQRLISRQPQNGVIAPLDLAMANLHGGGNAKPSGSDASHLSPVYETTNVTSPVAARKQGVVAPVWLANKSSERDGVRKSAVPDTPTKDSSKQVSTRDVPESDRIQSHKPSSSSAKLPMQRETGHVRAAKSEGDGGWQKAASKGKKKNSTATTGQVGHAETPPRHDSDRKGG